MALGDHYRVKLSANLLGQTVLNIFYHENVVTDSNAPALLLHYTTTVIPALEAISNEALTYTDLEIQNMENPTDFAVGSFSANGNRVGQVLPPFASWGFTLNPNTLVNKAGAKRFAGVSEGDQIDGVPIPLMLTLLTSVANTLGGPLPTSGGAQFRPRIARFDPDGGGEIIGYTNVNSATFKWVTTQSSRKFGKGV